VGRRIGPKSMAIRARAKPGPGAGAELGPGALEDLVLYHVRIAEMGRAAAWRPTRPAGRLRVAPRSAGAPLDLAPAGRRRLAWPGSGCPGPARLRLPGLGPGPAMGVLRV
jgi:hypothetical protein